MASSLLVDQPPMANSLLPDLTSDAPETNFVFHLVSEEDVFKFLRTMDVTKATGADNIPAKILRIAAPCISRNITHLLNVFHLTGQFPLSWKVARVTQVSKGGSLTECDNYRPISILPNVSKVHEFFANLNLMQYAQQFDLIGQHQFAYARNSSTTVALIKAVDSWKMAIDSGEKIVSAFLDLMKAFDIIDHNTLLNRMRNNGVTGIELKWFNSYLKERYQYVSCGGEESSKRSISHGVPQGSILGPTLFNIHVNDICKVCRNTNVFLYADDTELHATSSEINIAERLVNEDLTNIANWWRQNGL